MTMTVDTRIDKSVRKLPGAPGCGPEGLVLEPSPALAEFSLAAAAAGLSLPDAVVLALERALVLLDASALGIDSELARRRLVEAAREARPRLELGKAEAERVRALSVPQPSDVAEVATRLVVPVPPRLLARARGRVSSARFRAGAVPEMVAWKLAATLEGRTMGEWALLVLGRR